MKLLAWTTINNLYEKSLSRISLPSEFNNIHSETIELLNQMSDIFTGNNLKAKNSYYLKESFSLVNLIVINYYQQKRDRVYTVDHLFFNSWGEPYHYGFRSTRELSKILFQITKDGAQLNKKFEDYCFLYGSTADRNFVNHIKRTFKECYLHSLNKKTKRTRFLTKLYDNYVAVTKKEIEFTHIEDTGINQFAAELSENPLHNVKYHVAANSDPILERIDFVLKNASSEKISIYYEIQGSLLLLFIVNENKNIFISIKPVSQKDQILTHLFNFSLNCIESLKKVNPFTHLSSDSIDIQQLVPSGHPAFTLKRADYTPHTKNISANSFSLCIHSNNSYQVLLSNSAITSPDTLHNTIENFAAWLSKNPNVLKQFGLTIISNIVLSGFKQNPNLNTNNFLKEKFKADKKLTEALQRKRSVN